VYLLAESIINYVGINDFIDFLEKIKQEQWFIWPFSILKSIHYSSK
jgi:hypothetical protein